MQFKDSTGDTTNSTGTGSLVGLGVPPVGARTPSSASIANGYETVIRIETEDATIWELCETTITLAAGVYSYSRGTLIASSTGSRISFPAGTNYIGLTIDATHLQVLPMIDATADITLAINTAYRANDIDKAFLALPATAPRGSVIEVFGYELFGFRITVPNGKVIHIAGAMNSTATNGTGYIESVGQYDMVRLRCIVTDNEWIAELYGCAFN